MKSKDHDMLSKIWKEQEVESMEISLETIQAKALKFEKTIRHRNWREWIACCLIIPFFGWKALTEEHAISQLGALIVIISALYIAYKLYRDGRTKTKIDTSLSTIEYQKSYKQDLLDQSKLLKKVPYWYLGPIVLGLLVLETGELLEAIQKGSSLTSIFMALGIIALVFIGVTLLNLYIAKKLKDEANELNVDES